MTSDASWRRRNRRIVLVWIGWFVLLIAFLAYRYSENSNPLVASILGIAVVAAIIVKWVWLLRPWHRRTDGA